MSGCCAKCKVPFEWCGARGACACHARRRARPEPMPFEEMKAALDAELRFVARRAA